MLKYYVDLCFLEGNMESTNINEKIEEIKSKKYDEEIYYKNFLGVIAEIKGE